MGAQIGCELALAGHDVVFYVRNRQAATVRVEAAFALARRAGLLAADAHEEVVGRVSWAATVAEGAERCDVVLESVAEDIELKGRLLTEAARVAPRALLATNTSSLRITDIGEAAGAPERTVGMHYLNPPLLMPPVEIVAGERTSSESVELALELAAGAGKVPVVVSRDVNGFAWNRLQVALLRESVRLIEDGVLTAEDVDAIVREGLAPRWRRLGPLEGTAVEGADAGDELTKALLPVLSVASRLPALEGFAVPGPTNPDELRRRDDALIQEL